MEQTSLDDIRLFVAVVQAGSLSQASALTGIPVSRLSRRLTQLEQSLGTQLINRGKKGVSLNELGERFFMHAQNMLQQANVAIGSIHTSLAKPTGLLKISAPVDLYYHVLSKHLDDYLRLYPDVSVDVNANQQKINMIQDGVDVALRVGAIENENVVAKHLFDLNFGIFATPEYLAKHGTPHTPYDLYQHQVVAQSLSLPWRFQLAQQMVEINPTGRVSCNDFLLVEQMISKGVGVGMLSTLMSRHHPHLVQVLTDWQIPSKPVSLIYYKNRGAVSTVRSFVAWLMVQSFQAA